MAAIRANKAHILHEADSSNLAAGQEPTRCAPDIRSNPPQHPERRVIGEAVRKSPDAARPNRPRVPHDQHPRPRSPRRTVRTPEPPPTNPPGHSCRGGGPSECEGRAAAVLPGGDARTKA